MRARERGLVAYLAWATSVVGCVGCVVWFLLEDHAPLLEPLTLVLLVGVLVARLATTRFDGSLVVSGSLSVSMLAVAFLGPAAAIALEWIGEGTAFAVERYRRWVLPINLLATGLPLLIAGTVFPLIAPASGVGFFAALALVATGALLLNFLIVAVLGGLADGEPLSVSLRPFASMLPATALTVALVVATAAVYERLGIGVLVFVVVLVLAFTYMARLVVTARERTRQYASLSWGVLSGLLRSLDQRDPRMARHAAATAAFARDIARATGLSQRDQELAHTAGLLHDIGQFALSDRTLRGRGEQLGQEDWQAIQRHPILGADMLRDLGVYGPVAEIVRCHHERIDGLGYPRRLSADEIPELAKIVAVAEIYDVLTAADSYRTPTSSFQALTELRRVAGTQVDSRYVEALAKLLAGRDLEYRHADGADFDHELDIQRRISEAAEAPPTPPNTTVDADAS